MHHTWMHHSRIALLRLFRILHLLIILLHLFLLLVKSLIMSIVVIIQPWIVILFLTLNESFKLLRPFILNHINLLIVILPKLVYLIRFQILQSLIQLFIVFQKLLSLLYFLTHYEIIKIFLWFLKLMHYIEILVIEDSFLDLMFLLLLFCHPFDFSLEIHDILQFILDLRLLQIELGFLQSNIASIIVFFNLFIIIFNLSHLATLVARTTEIVRNWVCSWERDHVYMVVYDWNLFILVHKGIYSVFFIDNICITQDRYVFDIGSSGRMNRNSFVCYSQLIHHFNLNTYTLIYINHHY